MRRNVKMENNVKIFYCRIGWMEFYEGDDNERPINGGSYNKGNVGHEIYNFKNYDGTYYGYVGFGKEDVNLKIEKIDGSVKNDDRIENMLVVWISKSPNGGEYIVGWYNNAIIYREFQKVSKEIANTRKEGYDDYIISTKDAILLNAGDRVFKISNSMGQSNVWYDEDKKMYDKVLGYIENYERNFDYTDAEKNAIDSLLINDDTEATPYDMELKPQEIITLVGSNKEIPKRNIDTAKKALKHSSYVCEYDKNDRLFLRKNSDKNYTEPHHLIPLSYYKDFKYALDVEQNIVSLCSHCHNLLHYGRFEDKVPIIEKLWNDRKSLLKEVGIEISLEKLKEYYK